MKRTDVLAHSIVTVAYLVAVVALGLGHVIDGDGILAMLAGGSSIIGTLTAVDHVAYRNGKTKPLPSDTPGGYDG